MRRNDHSNNRGKHKHIRLWNMGQTQGRDNILLVNFNMLYAVLYTQECYLVYILMEMSGSAMVFTRTCSATLILSVMLRNLGLRAVPINGRMTQVCFLLVYSCLFFYEK